MDTTAVLSTLNELTQLVGAAVDKTALTRLKTDLAGYFKGAASGAKLAWCDGILTKLANGSATYKGSSTGPFGATIPFTVETGLAALRIVPAIKISWETAYPGAFAAEDVLMLIDRLKALIGEPDIQTSPVPPVVPPVALNPPSLGKIQWLTTRAEAMAEAKRLNRPIFMLAGKNSCSVTTGMRDFICELPDAANPNASPVKALIEQHFIPWFAAIDGAGHIEFEEYAPAGMFNMPLMAVIDQNGVIVPKTDPDGTVRKYINGNKKDTELFEWLQQYV